MMDLNNSSVQETLPQREIERSFIPPSGTSHGRSVETNYSN